MKDKKVEIKLKWVKFKFSSVNKFFKPNKETAPRIGIDNKKDTFAASYLLNFKILAAVIAIPDRLTPGIKDNTWNSPIKSADL